jgi:hypothetical protein
MNTYAKVIAQILGRPRHCSFRQHTTAHVFLAKKNALANRKLRNQSKLLIHATYANLHSI